MYSLILLCLLSFANKGDNWVTLKAKAVDCCDRPLANVSVRIWYLEGDLKGSLRYTALSDKDGCVKIETLKGKIKVDGVAVCTKFQSQVITLNSDTTITVRQEGSTMRKLSDETARRVNEKLREKEIELFGIEEGR